MKNSTNAIKNNNLARIVEILKRIKQEDIYENGFSQDKLAIEKIFAKTLPSNKCDVLARLTVVDSMYSTQMSRRYFGLDELADSLLELSKYQNNSTKSLFEQFAKNPGKDGFTFKKGTSVTNLFDEKYGIGKDGKDKGIAISLISKYAYFETEKNFPIYDSIVCEMFPKVWIYCGFEKHDMPKLIVRVKGKMDVDATATMISYVSAINTLICKLGGDISYDYLDRLLWFVGKIYRGNLSLVLGRKEFENCIIYSNKNKLLDNNGDFQIAMVKDVTKLPFVKKGSLLEDFFKLAKDLKSVK